MSDIRVAVDRSGQSMFQEYNVDNGAVAGFVMYLTDGPDNNLETMRNQSLYGFNPMETTLEEAEAEFARLMINELA